MLNYIRNLYNLLLDLLLILFDFHLPKKIRKLAPLKYNASKAPDNKSCVIGSVDGVIMAPRIVAITTTYFHDLSIDLPEIIPNNPTTICITGT